MSFFQNVFDTEFRGNLLLSDRQYTITFNVRGNRNSTQAMTAWTAEPYNVASGSSQNNLTLKYSFDSGRTWTSLVVDVSTTAVSPAAALANEVVNALNGNATFAALFVASVNTDNKGTNYVVIKSLRSRVDFRAYVVSTSAEIALRFNKYAPIAELPTYFARHTIANVNVYPDSVGMLIQLATSGFDAQMIDEQGFDHLDVQDDWELIRGRSGLFTFKKQTVDSSSRITEIIEYGAGALAGDLAKKTTMSYTGTKTQPDAIAEVPYVLSGSDLITPP